MLPADARPVGPSAGLVEGPDGGVVVVFGLATFGYAAGDDLGRRLAAVQLAATKVAAAAEVAAAFGVSGVTLWRWGASVFVMRRRGRPRRSLGAARSLRTCSSSVKGAEHRCATACGRP